MGRSIKPAKFLHGPEKSVKQWQTVWRDLKSVSSKKASKLRAERRRTGNFPVNESPLQNIEKRVISAIGMEYVEGNVTCPDSCVENDIQIEQLEMGDEESLYQIPEIISFQDEVIFENEERLEEEVPDTVDEEENLTLEDIESVICNVPRTTEASAINKKSRVSGTKQCLEQPTICPTSDAASSNRRNRQRISAQLQDAREQFVNIAETNSNALKIIAESF